ncbi:MAG: type IV pilus assembly protein PilM [Candidatus Omnitrophota bacterium]|nr:type IV pilus assembly protein PilM [Candidatus Omnitrophota bacterium]MDZ4242527.1 type IV pilus assembly protein PilM [Candidatus Omnitrophota bacterium]
MGIDLGDSAVKLVEVRKKGEKYELTGWAIEPVSQGNIKDAIKNILSKVKAPGKAPFTAVHGKGTLIRCITMPRMTLAELKKSFSLEADKYFPFPLNQIYTDCYILDPRSKESKMPVLVAASKKELVEERLSLLTSLGLQPDFITLNAIAMANILDVLTIRGLSQAELDKKSTAVAILDMGDQVSNLTIFVDKVPWFTRDIFVGGREVTRNISHTLGVSLEEAEKLKSRPSERQEEVLNAADSALSHLVSEVRLSFDYFITEKNVSIPLLLLTGGGSMMPGIEDLLANNLEVKVKPWTPFEDLELAPGLNREEINAQASKLTIALGLALYQ